MRSKLPWASGFAVAATMLTALVGAETTGASAEEAIPTPIAATADQTPAFIAEPVVQDVPPTEDIVEEELVDTDTETPISASSLRELVAEQPQPRALSREMKCLAGAVYFESRGESLAGQLAVGRVIVERASSPRFPGSYCGVVLQRSQFSFVRGGRIPTPKKLSAAWKRAVAIAQIAHSGSWNSPVEGALFFHATYVKPQWRLTRLDTVDNHVFYR